MGHAVSMRDIVATNEPQIDPQIDPLSHEQNHTLSRSRSNSSRSLSQISYVSSTSIMSNVSNVTVSLSDKFVSYENTLIHIPPSKNTSNRSMKWKLRILPKYNDDSEYFDDNDEKLCIVFGICDATLIEEGYKHKYYGFGYSVTYCHNIKFQSFVTTFDKKADIFIRYNCYKGEISFWCDGVMKQRRIRISPHVQNVITVKCYNDGYHAQICN